MKRRCFIGAAGAAVSAAALPRVCSGRGTQGAGARPAAVGRLGGLSLKELRDQYRSFLFDDFLPFMEKHVIDGEQGGFLCGADRDGTRLDDSKTPTNEGRGIWVWSFLYNELAREQRYLDVARRSLDLILRSRPDGDALWPRALTRDGKAAAAPDVTVYGDLYIAAGIAEYARAARDADSWRLAKNIMEKCLRVYERPDYDSLAGADPVPGPRRQNVSMLLLPTTTSLLASRSDPEVEAVAASCVNAVVERHFNPAYALNNDILRHDYERGPGSHAQYVGFGISLQTLWMILLEGVRRKDRKLYDTAAARIVRHVEVGWDDVYGGVMSGLTNVDANTWNTGKPLHNQVEPLIGLLAMVEHTGDLRAAGLFDEIYAFTVEKYVLKKYGFPLWQHDADRRVTYEPHTRRAEHFHNSRHLMMNLAALNRLVACGGRADSPFS